MAPVDGGVAGNHRDASGKIAVSAHPRRPRRPIAHIRGGKSSRSNKKENQGDAFVFPNHGIRPMFLFLLIVLNGPLGYCAGTPGNHEKSGLFGIDIDQLTGASVAKALGAAGVSFESSDPYPDAVSVYGHPEQVVAPRFIGGGLEASQITRVRYEFDEPDGTVIEIDLKPDYLKILLGQLTRKLGKYQFGEDEEGSHYAWIHDDPKKSPFSEISLEDAPGNNRDASGAEGKGSSVALTLRAWTKVNLKCSAGVIPAVSLGPGDAHFKDALFGLNINHMTGASVLRALKEKGASYTIPFEPDWNKDPLDPDNLSSPFYLGRGFDPAKILRVDYDFDPLGTVGNEITIDFSWDYRNGLLEVLKKTFGKFKMVGLDHGSFLCYWKTAKPSDFLFGEISLLETKDEDGPTTIERLIMRGRPAGGDSGG
jgi:hypothetical protein